MSNNTPKKSGSAFASFSSVSSSDIKKQPGANKKIILAVILAIVVLGLCAGAVALYVRMTTPDYSDVPYPTVNIIMETGDEIHLELYPAVAPNTVANFVSLAQSGYYDGLIFHRVIPGFVVQGGDPNGDGTGGPGYAIKGEFTENGFKNNLSHERGVISMARSQSPNSAGSQFFIMHKDNTGLDGKYAAFGKITDATSLTTIDKIAATKTDANDKPLTEWRIKSVTVDTYGVTYEPATIK